MDLRTELVETHVSSLFFVGDRVYKAKKPIVTPFSDFTTVTARGVGCQREVELNRRLAPDVYLGVADVTMDGTTIDHLVVMKRLPEERRLAHRLGLPGALDDLRHIAHLVATFHAANQRSAEVDRASDHDAVARLWESGIDQTASYAGTVLDAVDVAEVAGLARGYLDGRGPLFEQRVRSGHAVDGHGDLQAEDIFCLDDGPRILDCLEFDDTLRFGDAANDVAFLAMDLERLGHPELAEAFLARYRELTEDHWPTSLTHFYIAYRSHVRAKVACIRHDQGDPDAAATAAALHSLALAHLRAAEPLLVIVGGSPGTGKSTLARVLAAQLEAVRLSTDEIRDDLFPRADTPMSPDGIGAGRYRPELVARTYDQLLAEAEVLVGLGERVVLDASWVSVPQRQRVREIATRSATRMIELRCDCPPEVAAERIERRARLGTDPSEATAAVADRLAATMDPWPEATVIDTGAPVAGALAAAAHAVAAGR